MTAPIHILHLITGLDAGGAENTLHHLVSGMDQDAFQQRAVSLTPLGRVGLQMQQSGITVDSLNMPPGRPTAAGARNLLRLLENFRPQILQTWLYHADLLGLLAGRMAGIPAILWNVRSSNMDFRRYRPLSGVVARLCALLSRLPTGVVVNSKAGQAAHAKLGYRPRAWHLIPNGVNTSVYHPDPAARAALRAELGAPDHIPLIGMIARYDPMKGFDVFLQAAHQMAAQIPEVQFLLAGPKADPATGDLAQAIARHGLTSRVHLLGHRSDVPRLLATLDLLVSASLFGEGSSNVILEAMSCGIPVVASNVGDAAELLGPAGILVPPGDAATLASSCMKILRTTPAERAALGAQARSRANKRYRLETMATAYQELYRAQVGQLQALQSDGL